MLRTQQLTSEADLPEADLPVSRASSPLRRPLAEVGKRVGYREKLNLLADLPLREAKDTGKKDHALSSSSSSYDQHNSMYEGISTLFNQKRVSFRPDTKEEALEFVAPCFPTKGK